MSNFTTEPFTTNPYVTNPYVTNPWMTYYSPIDAKPTAGQTLTLDLSLPAGKTVTIDWGDGNTTNVIGPVSSVDYTNTYADAGTYPIRMSGDYQDLTRLEIKDVKVVGTTERLGALSGLTYFKCYAPSVISGDVVYLPAGLLTFDCGGPNYLSGDVSDLSRNLVFFSCYGYNILSGNIANLPRDLIFFVCGGQTTLSGNVADLPIKLTYFSCTGKNTISNYTTPHTWTTKPSTFKLVPVAPGGLSTAEIDQLLIDFDDDLTWSSGNVIELTGSNAGRSSASDAAVSNIVAEGCTVTTN